MDNKPTPESIIEILHSIKKLSTKDGELDVWFDDDQYPCVYRSFIPGSFTRELLELIELHLIPENFEKVPEERTNLHIVSEEDMEYLKGEPAPLKITIPIVIEKPDEQNS